MSDKIPEPTQGGRYVRNPDGTLTLQERTEEAPQRDKRETEAAANPTTATAPAAGISE